MFDGTLGVYPHKKFHIDIDPNAKPVYARPYPIPRIHLQTFKKELDHLVKLGVLKPQNESKWTSPTFITAKKDGQVRWADSRNHGDAWQEQGEEKEAKKAGRMRAQSIPVFR